MGYSGRDACSVSGGLTAQESKYGTFRRLDVSVAETSICIVDEHGKIARERKVPTEPEAIITALNGSGQVCKRIGLEAGPLSQ
jgi:transposase